MKALIVASVVVIAACNGGKAGVDAGRYAGVFCSGGASPTSCALPDQACCVDTTNPTLDTCYAIAGGSCRAGGTVERCDGPEDCDPGQVCCDDTAGHQRTCVAASACSAPAEVMCHASATCAAPAECCFDAATSIGHCKTGLCPGSARDEIVPGVE